MLRIPGSIIVGLAALAAHAQTDEIQVYDASIADPGEFEATLHSNYTPNGRLQPEFPGGTVPNHSDNGAAEFAYGYRDDWEWGLYFPVYTFTADGSPRFDGFKLRSLWVSPHARQREFFYGLNVELSYNLPYWDYTRTSLELRPIVGWHLGPWDVIWNPIIDSNFNGSGNSHFAPAERVAYNVSTRWALGVELYSDLGPMRRFADWPGQSQTVFAIVDFAPSARTSIEFGAGHGMTPASDDWIVKLILNRSL